MLSLSNALWHWGSATPHAPALRSGEGETTYAALAALAADAALTLALNGVGPGDVVHVPAHKSPTTIAAIAGADRIGAVALVTAEDLDNRLRARLLPTARAVVSVIPAAVDRIELDVRRVPALAFASPRGHLPTGTQLILCTSGSTGDPKLVPLTRDGISAFLAWASTTFGIATASTVASVAPLNFDISLLDVWTTLSVGGVVQFVTASEATSADVLAGHVESGVEVLQAVPTTLRLLVGSGREFPGVRHVISTRDTFPAELASDLRRSFPAAVLHNAYGATETNNSMVWSLEPHEPVPALVPTGRPLDGVRARVVDAEGQDLIGSGTGELLVATPFSSPGYLTEEGLDARRWSTGEGLRWYRTGDVVQRDHDGEYRAIEIDHSTACAGGFAGSRSAS